jgi:hypothetical protein
MGLNASKRDRGARRIFRWYSFAWVTAGLFLLSWAGQFAAQVAQVANESGQHGQAFEWSDFWPEFLASTFENWQSEFLQLVWQAAGLAILYFVGSSQSRESDDRIEAMVREVCKRVGLDPDEITSDIPE